jgi:hypothetical protein
MIDQSELEKVKYFNYLYSMITNDANGTGEMKSRIAMARQYSTRINQQIGLKFKEETSKLLHFEHSFLWC